MSSKTKENLLLAMRSVYYRPEVTNKQRAEFVKALSHCMRTDPKMTAGCALIAKMLQLKALAPDIASAFETKNVKLVDKLILLKCLRSLDKAKYGYLKGKLRKQLMLEGDRDKMFEYAVALKDKKMKLYLRVLDLRSSLPSERLRAVLHLRKATGKNFGFNPMGSEKEREAAFEKWKSYLEESDL